jgi:hypothetical protein
MRSSCSTLSPATSLWHGSSSASRDLVPASRQCGTESGTELRCPIHRRQCLIRANCEELTQNLHIRVAPNNRHGAAERKRPSPSYCRQAVASCFWSDRWPIPAHDHQGVQSIASITKETKNGEIAGEQHPEQLLDRRNGWIRPNSKLRRARPRSEFFFF